jgi:hypothetical protein
MRTRLLSAAWATARRVRQACGLFLILAGSAGTAFGVVPASSPEIDPGSAASALTLLVGGMLMLVDRVRRR